MFDFLIPTYIASSAYSIDYKHFYNEGYKGVIFDIDNTLVHHDKDSNESVELFVYMLEKIGYKVMILSNNDNKRVEKFCKDSNIKYFIPNANKPSKKNYYKISDMANVEYDKVICVGDQLFTDIWGANNAKMLSILVDPMGKEIHFYIEIKRVFERFIKLINKNKFLDRKI